MSKNTYGKIHPNEQLSELGQTVSTYYSDLEGKLLTIIDSSITNQNQLDAVKSLIRQGVWENFRLLISYLDTQK